MFINCKGHLIDLESPKVMGILNLTPDSFYDGGKYKSEKGIIKQVEKMHVEGATFIDLGAYSSRPKAKDVSEDEELHRLLPVLELLVKEFPDIFISVDTFRSRVAREAINRGACMINDISAGALDDQMFSTVAQCQVPYIIMHMIGTPQTMGQHVFYKNLIKEMIYYFSQKIFQLRELGINDLIIDPGFGFSKTLDQNFELLQKLELFKSLNLPVLAGLSRKSMLYNLLDINPEQALNATTSANTIALMKGTNILRVHDVKEAMDAVRIVEKMTNRPSA